MTANTYIRNHRLSLAGKEIIETDARKAGARLVLFNPLVIRITVEGGISIDYRIVQTKEHKFIALTRSFRNEIINDEENHEIPDFWNECHEQNLLEPIKKLRPKGKCDLNGLCSSAKEEQECFEYGIGVMIDEETQDFDLEEIIQQGYRIWNLKPGTYVVFECVGEDGNCISTMWEKFYKEFLPQMGCEAEEAVNYEMYYEKAKQGIFCEL